VGYNSVAKNTIRLTIIATQISNIPRNFKLIAVQGDPRSSNSVCTRERAYH